MDSAISMLMEVCFFHCSESLWPIEARNAAIANSYFTVAINRVGTVSHILIDSNVNFNLGFLHKVRRNLHKSDDK